MIRLAWGELHERKFLLRVEGIVPAVGRVAHGHVQALCHRRGVVATLQLGEQREDVDHRLQLVGEHQLRLPEAWLAAMLRVEAALDGHQALDRPEIHDHADVANRRLPLLAGGACRIEAERQCAGPRHRVAVRMRRDLVLDVDLEVRLVDQLQRSFGHQLREQLRRARLVDQLVAFLDDRRLETAQQQRYGILHVGEDALRVDQPVRVHEIRRCAAQLLHILAECRQPEQHFLRARGLQDAEVSRFGQGGANQLDRVGQAKLVGSARIRLMRRRVEQSSAADQGHRGTRIEPRDLARALLVPHHAPCAAGRQHHRTTCRDDEAR